MGVNFKDIYFDDNCTADDDGNCSQPTKLPTLVMMAVVILMVVVSVTVVLLVVLGTWIVALVVVARRLFAGFGHTKMIDAGNREVRNDELHETPNKTLCVCKQWDIMHTRRTLPQGTVYLVMV